MKSTRFLLCLLALVASVAVTVTFTATRMDVLAPFFQQITPQTGLTSGLVGHWTMDGPSTDWGNATAEVKDIAGSKFNGNALGALATINSKPRNIGQAMEFNGTSNYVRKAHNAALEPTDELTYAAWIKTDAVNAHRIIMQKSDIDVSPYNIKAFTLHWNVLRMRIFNGAFTSFDVVSGATINPGQWYHAAVTIKDNNFVKIYQDGVEVYSNTSVGNLLLTDTHDFTIGAGLNNPTPGMAIFR